MPAKLRKAKALRPQFGCDVLELFLELEHAPARWRRTDAFMAKEKRLMYALGLVAEFWTMNSVLDIGPCYTSPTYVAWHDFFQCRAVRAQLLAATGAGEVQEHPDRTTRQSAPPH